MPWKPRHGTHAAWHQQTLPPNSLTFFKWYMLFISLSMIVSALALRWQGYSLTTGVFWWLIPTQCLASLGAVLLSKPGRQITTGFYLLLLFFSMLLLGWFLHDSGGHTNPLISILLLPIAMAAAILGWQASVIIALIAIGIYTGLTEFYIPLAPQTHDHAHHQQFMQLHLLGMWITFSLSALLLLLLVQPMAASIRRQKERLAQQREDTLRDEQLIALATFAASAAHQIGTPLSTIGLLMEELKHGQDPEHREQDWATMESQVQICKQTLQGMMRKAEHIRNGTVSREPISVLLKHLQEQFTLIHPGLKLQLKPLTEELEQQHINYDPTLEQALLNLLDNAAKASASNPIIGVTQRAHQIGIIIEDKGPGLPRQVSEDIGKPFVPSDSDGMGLGLFLSNATINRLGGQLKIVNQAEGTRAEIWLPNSLTTGTTDG